MIDRMESIQTRTTTTMMIQTAITETKQPGRRQPPFLKNKKRMASNNRLPCSFVTSSIFSCWILSLCLISQVPTSVNAWMEHKMFSAYKSALWKAEKATATAASIPTTKVDSQSSTASPSSTVALIMTNTACSAEDMDHTISAKDPISSPFLENDMETSDEENVGNPHHKRQRHSLFLGKGRQQATILSRTVPIDTDWTIKVWEWEKPSAVIETYWQAEQQGLALTGSSSFSSSNASPLLDPFGLVCWPGSVVAAQELKAHQEWIQGKQVVVLGAGVGIEAQAAAMLGAKKVIATDIHPTTLQLLQYGAEQAGYASVIDTLKMDITQRATQPLPECDVLIVADVLYNQKLALQVMDRVLEARVLHNATVLVTDSQRFVSDFDSILQKALEQEQDRHKGAKSLAEGVQWRSRWLSKFTGSGVVIDQDQTYEVKARSMWLGEPPQEELDTSRCGDSSSS